MPRICAADHEFEIDCIVIDKDGTLIDFEAAWGQRTVLWVESLMSAVNGDEALAASLFKVLGYNLQRRQVAVDGPILATSAEKMVTLAAGVLYAERGLPWHEAEKVAVDTARAAYYPALTDEEIYPIGDVKGAVKRFRDAGITVAVVTADNRDTTEHCLDILGIRQHVAFIMCGDDPLPQKPDAAVLAWIAHEIDSDQDKILMVGDTINDMLTGRNGSAAGCIGISPHDHSDSAILAAYADVLLPTIAGLQVECSAPAIKS